MTIEQLDLATRAAAQKLLMEAGYEPRGDWLYIGDLVEKFRTFNAGNLDVIQQVDDFLATEIAPSRIAFKRYTSDLERKTVDLKRAEEDKKRLESICAAAGSATPDASHVALACRIAELEDVVKSYAEQLRKSQLDLEKATTEKTSGMLPFTTGVIIGGALF